VLVDSAQLAGPIKRVKALKRKLEIPQWQPPHFWNWTGGMVPTSTSGQTFTGIPYTTTTGNTASYYTASTVTPK
jgi:hypothetical protein